MDTFQTTYHQIAQAFRFEDFGRYDHKYAGVRRIPAASPHPGADFWVERAEAAVSPVIYRWHYLRVHRGGSDRIRGRTIHEQEDSAFVDTLSLANRSSGIFEPGWALAELRDTERVYERDGRTV